MSRIPTAPHLDVYHNTSTPTPSNLLGYENLENDTKITMVSTAPTSQISITSEAVQKKLRKAFSTAKTEQYKEPSQNHESTHHSNTRGRSSSREPTGSNGVMTTLCESYMEGLSASQTASHSHNTTHKPSNMKKLRCRMSTHISPPAGISGATPHPGRSNGVVIPTTDTSARTTKTL